MDWYPWHYERYRLKTRHLTAEQDGIYRRLIDEYMETRQPLPDNDLALAGIARVDLSCFTSASSNIRAFFHVKKRGFLNHKTCDELLDEQDQLSKFRTERAKKAASARHNKTNKINKKSASSKLQDVLGHATITVNNNKSKDIIKPTDISDGVWSDWKSHRKLKKATITETVIKDFRKQSDIAGISLQQAIETSISRGWVGFKAEWLTTGEKNGKEPTGHAALAEIGRAARQQIERERLQGELGEDSGLFEPTRTGLLALPDKRT